MKYILPGVHFVMGSALLLMAAYRASLGLSYPDRMWVVPILAFAGLSAMLEGFIGIFWVNWKGK